MGHKMSIFEHSVFYWSVSICKSASTVLQDEDNLTSRKSGNFYCLRIWLLYVDLRVSSENFNVGLSWVELFRMRNLSWSNF